MNKILIYIVFIFINISLNAQEKEVKIKEGGEFSFSLKFNNTSYNGVYYGSFTKSKIDGEKVKIPYGNGKFVAENITYDGGWVDGLFSGQGTFVVDSFQYNGSFLNGLKNGLGVIIYKSKEKYEGEWKDDLPNGKGKIKYSNGDVYEGSILNGLREGYGKFRFKLDLVEFQKATSDTNSFNVFEGNFIQNQINGQGQLICKDGFILKGEWLKFNFNGDGRLYLSNSRLWKGQIKGNQPNGKGVMSFSNGDTYDGEWLDNNFNGIGVYKFKDGSKWEGSWKNGVANGLITKYSSKGEVIASGSFLNNKMNGNGFKVLNGNKWDGNWDNDIPLGKGVIYFSNSNVYKGDWAGIKKEDNVYFYMHGIGTMKYINGDEYNGEWLESKRSGKGKLILSNGEILDGNFQNDLFIEVYNPKTVNIGTQIWTAENLNVDHFKNGDKIKQVNSYEELVLSLQKSEPAFCYLDFKTENGKKYGKLYNIFALQDPRGLAPDGWSLPKVSDFKLLISFLGGGKLAFDKIKASGKKLFTLDITNINLRNLISEIEQNENGTEGLSNYIDKEGDLNSNNEINSGNNLSGFNALPGLYYKNNDEPTLIFAGSKNYYQSLEGFSALFLSSDNGLLCLIPILKATSEGGYVSESNKEKLYYGSVRLLKN